ncbi:MAG: RNase adapter RapZ [Hasllibacter sp.]
MSARTVLLVTGPSGAGRGTAIRALEDEGFEAIDNIPLDLVPRLLTGGAPARPMAIGLDVRNRAFSAEGVERLHAGLAAREGIAARLLYLDCSDGALLRRFSETRRRHPLAKGEDPATGIAREKALLAPLAAAATDLIDTTALSPHDLKAELARRLALSGAGLAITVQSFSYKWGVPRGADIVLDCRFLSNPHWDEALRPLDGRDPRVAAHVAADPRHGPFRAAALALLEVAVPGHVAEGRAHLTLGLGCTGGRHRSVTLAEDLGRALEGPGRRVSIRHRELERRAAGEGARPEGAGEAR